MNAYRLYELVAGIVQKQKHEDREKTALVLMDDKLGYVDSVDVTEGSNQILLVCKIFGMPNEDSGDSVRCEKPYDATKTRREWEEIVRQAKGANQYHAHSFGSSDDIEADDRAGFFGVLLLGVGIVAIGMIIPIVLWLTLRK